MHSDGDPSYTNICLLSLQRDPSETVSVKDVLARAAAKGLLDGVEVGKAIKRTRRGKKQKHYLPELLTMGTHFVTIWQWLAMIPAAASK